ncbi:hypothetical protein F2Q70_00030633 [Brassica cretica]|uniref:Uncharacterized protein n=1 Tax=Brassica cretica TaxID=69181 RepID=A0A8S9GT49_BRACR|nr:hypothetical protein F2Q70_00030633 [Brassica cretica]KAF2549791.1 hypothetical protein F2Q68_00035063 [Brassica cretica]
MVDRRLELEPGFRLDLELWRFRERVSTDIIIFSTIDSSDTPSIGINAVYYLSPDLGLQLSLVGLEKVSINSNNRVSIDTPFSPSIDTTNMLSIDVPYRERYERV